MIKTVKYIAYEKSPTEYIGLLLNGEMQVPINTSNSEYKRIQRWMAYPASEDYVPQVGTASYEKTDRRGKVTVIPASADYAPQVGTAASDNYKGITIMPEPAFTEQEIADYNQLKAFTDGTKAISATIQNEIIQYNLANGIALASVHNAESYSRVDEYTHKAFCEQVWLWSVELWEFMRTWQSTLTALPTEAELMTKIAEKPFVYVAP